MGYKFHGGLISHEQCYAHTESGKVQDVYKSLLPLKSWLTGQQDKMDAMRPAAVVSTPLSDQITENEVS